MSTLKHLVVERPLGERANMDKDFGSPQGETSTSAPIDQGRKLLVSFLRTTKRSQGSQDSELDWPSSLDELVNY